MSSIYIPTVGMQELRAYQADVATVLRNGKTDTSAKSWKSVIFYDNVAWLVNPNLLPKSSLEMLCYKLVLSLIMLSESLLNVLQNIQINVIECWCL